MHLVSVHTVKSLRSINWKYLKNYYSWLFSGNLVVTSSQKSKKTVSEGPRRGRRIKAGKEINNLLPPWKPNISLVFRIQKWGKSEKVRKADETKSKGLYYSKFNLIVVLLEIQSFRFTVNFFLMALSVHFIYSRQHHNANIASWYYDARVTMPALSFSANIDSIRVVVGQVLLHIWTLK